MEAFAILPACLCKAPLQKGVEIGQMYLTFPLADIYVPTFDSSV